MTFTCLRCNKIFQYKSKLDIHNNRKIQCDSIKKDNNCQLCNANFNYKSDLDRHLQSKKHLENYKNQQKDNIESDNDLDEIIKVKKEQEKEYNNKLNEELNLKDVIINDLIKENENLKFDFNNNIKIDVVEENKELIPIFDKITTYKVLNKININDILTEYNKLLTIMELLYIINYDLNKLYVDKFWNNIESEDWIYLDEELIQWFGYKEISGGKEQLVKIIKREFEIDEDYKVLNNNDFLISDFNSGFKPELKYGPATRHLIMKPDCFKLTCLQVGTSKSKDIYKYYIEVEKIFKFYIKYTSEYNKFELEKAKLIKNRYINKSKLRYNSKLYLITTLMMAKENIFKFGSTVDENARKSTYNTGHVEADKFFYVAVYDCYDANYLEKYIARLLINFKIPNESEMYQLHFNALDSIIKLAINNNNNTVESINKFLLEDFDKYLSLEPKKFE